jgi:hypothetical protein
MASLCLILEQMLEGLGDRFLAVLAEKMAPLYRVVKRAWEDDTDAVTRFHASRALETLDGLMTRQIARPLSFEEYRENRPIAELTRRLLS